MFRELSLIKYWTTELQKINQSALSEKAFYKLRSDLFEVVSKSYLDDHYDEYITNAHNIFKMIKETNSIQQNMP